MSTPSRKEAGRRAVAAAERASRAADQQLTEFVVSEPAGGVLDLTILLELQRNRVLALEAWQRLLVDG